MSEFYDRADSGGTFIAGLFTGTLIGAALGLLLAPKTGTDLRRQIRSRAGDVADTAEGAYRRAADAAGDFAERGRELGQDVYERSRDAASRTADEAQRHARDAADGLSDSTGR